MRKLLAALIVTASVAAAPSAVAADLPERPQRPDRPDYIPAFVMGQRHALNVFDAMDDGKNKGRAKAVRAQVKATCKADQKHSQGVMAIWFTENAEDERAMNGAGKGATPNLTKKQTGGSAARLFPVPMSKSDKLPGFEKDDLTESERAMLRIYTEDMNNTQREQFAMSYLQVVCRDFR